MHNVKVAQVSLKSIVRHGLDIRKPSTPNKLNHKLQANAIGMCKENKEKMKSA